MHCQFQEWLVNMISVCAEGILWGKKNARGSTVSASNLEMCERADEVNHYLISYHKAFCSQDMQATSAYKCMLALWAWSLKWSGQMCGNDEN